MKKDLKKSNIENLTSLWKTVGRSAKAYHERDQLSWVDIGYSQWPNRLWLHQKNDPSLLENAVQVMQDSPSQLTLSCMESNGFFNEFESRGLIQISELIGMSMELKERYSIDQDLTLAPVDNASQASDWSGLFEQAFGYYISSRLLLPSSNSTVYYIIKYQGVSAGTVLVHRTDEVVGIHSMGVIPEMRRKGLARLVMHRVLSEAISEGQQIATLQASSMGRGLYEELGFEEQFRMKNYQLANI